MAVLLLADVARRAGGKILQGSPGLAFHGYGIDSRLTGPGELFFAIVGKRDGHAFVGAAAAAGALGAVVSKPAAVGNPEFGIVQVEDTAAALRDLARSVLADHPVKIIGVTGSIGKTTTKEFTATLLAARFSCLKSAWNFNNRLGLPLSLLRLEAEHEAAVLEMGMSAPGEIRELTRIAPPDVAVITNVQPVHLEFFASLEEIAGAKREILEGAGPGAAAVLNGDDPLLAAAAAEWPGRKVTFGLSGGCEVRAEALHRRGFDGLDFLLVYGNAEAPVDFPFINDALIPDFLAAAAVCRTFGFGLDEVLSRVSGLKPLAMRGVLLELGNDIRLYDDSYNSNPAALEAALKSLGGLPARRKLAVLADMLELGDNGESFHRRAGRVVALEGWNVLVTIGPLARSMGEGAAEAGLDRGNIRSFPDAEAAAAETPGLVRDGDLVLVKGSRGMRTEKVVEALKKAKGS